MFKIYPEIQVLLITMYHPEDDLLKTAHWTLTEVRLIHTEIIFYDSCYHAMRKERTVTMIVKMLNASERMTDSL